EFAIPTVQFRINPSRSTANTKGADLGDTSVSLTSMGEPLPGTQPPTRPSEDRLDSWKEIAAYLDRDVTTVQRWEKREGMPVHRHLHDRMGSVYASRTELDTCGH